MPDPDVSRKRKTKLEKIAEVEAEKKVLMEENRLLRKQIIQCLKGGGAGNGTLPNSTHSGGDERLKSILKSLKRVTVKQEMSLQAMRESANERRRQLTEKDEQIATLTARLRSMGKSMKSAERGDIDSVRKRIRELEKKCFEGENTILELRQTLARKDREMKQLEKKCDSHRDPFGFQSSSQSLSSNISAVSEVDVAKIKQELAKKSSRIVNLEYELESAKEELVDLRKRTSGNAPLNLMDDSFHTSFTVGEDGFPTTAPIGTDPFKTDPFANVGDRNLFSDSESESEEASDFAD